MSSSLYVPVPWKRYSSGKCPERGAILKSSLFIAFLSAVAGALTENPRFPFYAAPPNISHL